MSPPTSKGSDATNNQSSGSSLPSHARVAIIGGGVIGCSVAYHFAKMGWSDVVLLERKELTSGTTWHAAGLVGQLRPSVNMTKLARYTSELYGTLEAETQQATGYRQSGSISIATQSARLEELKRSASMAKVFGLPVDVLSTSEIGERYPLLNTSDVLGGIHIPSDGYANAVDVTQALAKGARAGGVKIFTHTEVTGIVQDGKKVTGVQTTAGDLGVDYVVICGGMWSRDLAASIGVNLPLHACEHYYVLFESVAGLTPDLPVLRDYDACAYYKYDAGKLLVGAFEPNAKPWGMGGISPDFCFDEIDGDFEHMAPVLQDAIHRIPALASAGIQKFFCGPESFTPDVRYHLGQAPELDNCFVAAGLNSIGLQSAGGIGKVVTEWVRAGHPPVDLWEVDVRRNMPFQNNRQYLHDRVSESLGLLYAAHWPYRQYETARGIRKSPLYDRLVAQGACHGEAFGWERPNWYAPKGTEPVYEYSFGRQNWFEHTAAECKAVRENVALFDLSSFSKFRLEGRDAMTVLNQICANEVDVAPGKLVYTQWLNPRGGIEADLTVTRLTPASYLIVGGAETEVRDFDWLTRHIPDDAHCIATNVTSAMGVISVMGPNARALLQSMTPDDLSNEGFAFGYSREIELGYARVRASRITYVGELGWELYIPTEFVAHVYDALTEAGKDFDLAHAGYHALNSLRIEKGYRHWGHDITDEDSPLQAGLGFAVKMKKPGGFIGRDALLQERDQGIARKMVQFLLADPEAMIYHNEPIWCDGAIVGHISSGAFAYTFGACIGLGYIPWDKTCSEASTRNKQFEIEVAGVRIPAQVSLNPFYDAKSIQIRR